MLNYESLQKKKITNRINTEEKITITFEDGGVLTVKNKGYTNLNNTELFTVLQAKQIMEEI